jgi:glycosyltransferase involved in cell wall biosynthesis
MNAALLLFYIFSLSMAYQLYVFLRYIIKLLAHKAENQTLDSQPASVVICAHNEIANLKKHLPGVLAQSHPQHEVIIVDDRSHDESYEWLLEQKATYPHLKVVRIDEVPSHINNKKYALSIGIKAAKYPIVVLTDADCEVASAEWLDRMSQSLVGEKELSLGASLYHKEASFLNLFIRFETYQTAVLYLSRALAAKAYMGVGRNLAYKKAIFLNNKGFNGYQGITGGDDDLFINKHASATNTAVVISSLASTYSVPKSSWKSFFQQKKRHLSVGKYYRLRDKIFLGGLQFSTMSLWISGILAITLTPAVYQFIIVGLLLLRWIGQYVVYYKVSIKFGDSFKPWLLPILELYYMFYYIIIGTLAIRSKRIKWK